MPAEKWGYGRAPFRSLRDIEEIFPFRPVPELEEMRRRFDAEITRPIMRAVWEHIPEEMKARSPALDVFEKGEVFVVKAELPGMKQEDIDVSVSEDVLTIKGERKPETSIKDEDYYRNEIGYGAFYRSLRLPSGVDARKIDAVYEDGFLRLTFSRTTGTKSQKVVVQIKKPAA
jgi:HSP20 family protein